MKRTSSESIDGGAVVNLVYDKYSGANKTVNMAPELIYVTSSDIKEIGSYETLHVYNDNSDTQFLHLMSSLEDSAGDFQKRRPLPPKCWSIVNNAAYTFICGDSGVYIYKVKSDSKVQG